MACARLNPKARKAVEELAREIKNPVQPYAAVTLACWMDDLRANAALENHSLFLSWHYIDLGLEPGEGLEPGDPQPALEPGDDNETHGNVVQALKRAVVVLKGGDRSLYQDQGDGLRNGDAPGWRHSPAAPLRDKVFHFRRTPPQRCRRQPGGCAQRAGRGRPVRARKIQSARLLGLGLARLVRFIRRARRPRSALPGARAARTAERPAAGGGPRAAAPAARRRSGDAYRPVGAGKQRHRARLRLSRNHRDWEQKVLPAQQRLRGQGERARPAAARPRGPGGWRRC